MPARWWWTALLLITLLTLWRVRSTHHVFSQTTDEPWHLIAGYDVLTKWSFTADLHHPPLARIFFALPFLDVPEPPPGDSLQRGNSLLLHHDQYVRNVATARLGNLLVLGLATVIVAVWARAAISPAAGLLAALMFASLPPILAHGGLATTDMVVTALLPVALLAFIRFVDEPDWKRTIVLGLAAGAGLLSKFSFILYFGCAAAALLLVRRKAPAPRVLLSLSIALLVVWAAFGFTVGSLREAHPRGVEFSDKTFGRTWVADIPFPAPLYWMGVLEVKEHNREGHLGFLFGELRNSGWWYYFPVAILFKTPIPFLLLALAGCALAVIRRQRLEIVIVAVTFLGVAMSASINLGIRHVLPLYVPLSICSAYAIVQMRRLRLLAVMLLAWLLIGSALAHPDYLPWFNAMAGRHPERILSDSNLDWGQDVLRLVRFAREKEISHLTVSLAGSTPLERVGLPPLTIVTPDSMSVPLHGWVAISEFHLVAGRSLGPEVSAWLDQWFAEDRPFQRVGKSIRVYRFQ
jgi:4-amino-4-deoxy-L-arabinose transferase-like glycosyltransferase